MVKFEIHNKGSYYKIPLEGFEISGIDMRDGIGLELKIKGNPSPTFVVDIYQIFSLTRFNQTSKLNPHSTKAIKLAIDLIGLDVKNAEGHKNGDLFLTLSDNSEIKVPDSDYESWHINVVKSERIKNSWVIGGVGSTSFYDFNNA